MPPDVKLLPVPSATDTITCPQACRSMWPDGGKLGDDQGDDRDKYIDKYCRPIPASLSQTSLAGTPPKSFSSSHVPAIKSPVMREGSIIAVIIREADETITNTGSETGLCRCRCASTS